MVRHIFTPRKLVSKQSEGVDDSHYPSMLQWSASLPPSLQVALKAADLKCNLVTAALSRTKGSEGNWFLQARDPRDECEWDTWFGSSLKEDILVGRIAVLSARSMRSRSRSLDIDFIDQVYFRSGARRWLVHTCTTELMQTKLEVWDHNAWHGLPDCLDNALNRYREAYGAVKWLSVGGRWGMVC